MNKIKIQIDENNKLLGYCTFGDMPNSIEIEVEENFEFKEDIQNYIFVDGRLEYNPCLERLKSLKRKELKEIRTKKIQADIEVHGELFQVRDSDKENFDDVGLMVRTGEIDYSYIKNWVLADNSIKPFTAQQIIDVWKERTKRKDNIFLQFGKLSMELEACNSVEEIEAIKWE